MVATSAVITYPLIRPDGQIDAKYLGQVGQNFVILNFDRPITEADLQGSGSRFPWTEHSKVPLTDRDGKPRSINCNRLARVCHEHNVAWLDSDYQACPKCSAS
jgi:hypothetical protein